MGNTAQKLFSIINIESIPAWNTITVTAAEHGLKSATGTALAPTQVIIESGLEWVASGTSVVITNRTNRDLSNTEAILTHQFSTEYDPTTVAVNVAGASPIASLVGITGIAQIPLDVGNSEEGEDTLVIPLLASDVSTLPVAAFSVDEDSDTVVLAQGVWRVEWIYSVLASGDDIANVSSTLIQDPAGAATPLFVVRASSSAYTLDAGDQTLEIGTQNRLVAGSWMINLSDATEANRTFSLSVANPATNGTVAGLGGSMTITKAA